MDTSNSKNITFCDLSQRLVKGKGKIFLRFNNDKKIYVSNVYYVPNIKNNIVSFGQLLRCENGEEQNVSFTFMHI